MNTVKFKNLPNCITAFRIIAAIPLLFVPTMTIAFYTLYTVIAISDALDGFIARRYHLESELGSKLDSIADLLFWFVVLVKIVPVIIVQFKKLEYAMMVIIFSLRLICYVIAFVKFHTFPSLHTFLNKLTGIALFVAMYLFKFFVARPVIVVVFIIAVMAVCQEIYIHLKTKPVSKTAET